MKKYIHTLRKLILFVAIIWTSLLNAQQYPVQVTPVLLPPYSLRLADYATTSDNKLQVQLLMKDLMEPSHRIKIRFSLESGVNSVTIAQNTPYVNGFQEITLYPGTPVTLTNVDLRALFRIENLTGISAANYARPLPEGMYKFCFQVFDSGTERALSAKSTAIAYLVQYEPPMLNLPQQGEKILKQNEFQNIIFQWMPRQMAPNTRYIFTLKELWDNQRDPVSGFLTSRPLWQEESYAPSLYYGIDKTALIPGKRYAWQVQAKSGNPVIGNSPTEDNGVYKNNGLSEIFYFDYVENCQVPLMLMAKNIGRGKTEIRWTMAGNSSGKLFRIQYRKKGSTSEWAQQESYQDMSMLTGLKDETEYEYRVGAVCGNLYQTGNTNMATADNPSDNAYAFSGIQFFTTNNKEAANSNVQCGILPQVDVSNKSLLKTALGTNEVFMAGDFPVTVLQSEGTSGTYSGYGYIQVSYLADTKIKVTFKNIKLNTDKQLIEGIIETTYDVNESALSYASQGIGETFGDRGVEPVIVDYVISEIQYSATPPPGKITIIGNTGGGNNNDTGSGESSRQELPAGKDYAITDKDGNVWHVDEKGNVSKGDKVAKGGASTSKNTEGITGSGSSAQVSEYTAKGIKVEWHETSNTKYTYDSPDKLSALKEKYPTVKDADGKSVYVSYKAVVNKSEDSFGARITFSDEALKDRKLVFKTLKIGEEILAQKGSANGSTIDYTLTLKGTMDYAEEDVIAVLMPKDSTQKQQLIGSFKLVHLEPKEINVTLVPTDKVSKGKLQDMKEQTNAIYSKVGVTINFNEDEIFDITPYLNGKDDILTEKNSLISTYSSVQRAINDAYGERNGDRYVLFVSDRKSSTGQMGYMRLGGRFGYIFKSDVDKELRKIVAHEIGHGVFQLEHPWEKYKTKEKTTDLLMDYSAGTNLFHLDWKQINDPALKFNFFQGQGKGMFNNRYALSPDFQLIFVPHSNIVYSKKIKDKPFVYGTLPGFIVEDGKGGQKGYLWNGSAYENEKDKTDIYKVQFIDKKIIDKENQVWLIYDLDKDCNEKSYMSVDYSNITLALSSSDKSKTVADLKLITKNLSFKRKPLGCSSVDAKQTKQEWIATDSINFANSERICELIYEKDLYDIENIITTAPGETLGDVRVNYLKGCINGNKNFIGTENLETEDVGNPHYIHHALDTYNTFADDKVVLDELNMKMAYLQASTGIKFYTTFYQLACTPTQGNIDNTAKKMLDKLALGDKGVMCVIAVNDQKDTPNSDKVMVGLAFGTGVSPEAQSAIKENIGGSYKIEDFNFSKKLIATYKAIPKRRVIYHYIIDKVTDEQQKDYEQRKAKYFSSEGATHLDGLTSTITILKDIPSEKTTGPALEILYHIHDKELNEYKTISSDKELKENYVVSDGVGLDINKFGENISISTNDNRWTTSIGLMTARKIAEKEAGWILEYYPPNGQHYISKRPITGTWFKYYYSGYPSASKEIIDDILFASSFIPSARTFTVVAGVAIIYYTANDEPDKALGYLVGFGLVKSAPVIVELIATSKAANYYRLWKSARTVIKEIDNQVVNFDRAALDAYLSSEKTLEYIAKNNISGNGNYWVFLNESEVMVGKLVEKGDDLILQTQYIAKYSDDAISQAVGKGGNLTDDQVNYLIRTAEKNASQAGKGGKLWTRIDERLGPIDGNIGTYYDVAVTYQSHRVGVGASLVRDNILEFHLNIPKELQKQGLASEIIKKAIAEEMPSKVKGWWKKKDIYETGESTNLTIFRQKLKEGLTPEAAALETPTGKIMKEYGFGGKPNIIKNTEEEVIIHFNPQ